MKIIEQDILAVTEGIICHQTNCMGVMGCGIAKQIADKWPQLKKDYQAYCRNARVEYALGKCLLYFPYHYPDSKLVVANLFGQEGYGRDKQYTDYQAQVNAICRLKELIVFNKIQELPIYVPYKMGCMNAGGDWNKVTKILEVFLPEVIVCKKP